MKFTIEPLVSVIIPSYNHSQFIQETIISIINQDYNNIELIIIDDGSTDNSIEKINELLILCENRFQRFEFRSRKNMGLTATLNESLEWCNGDFISHVASDDGWYPKKISKQVQFLLSNPDVPACCTNIEPKGGHGGKGRYTKNKLVFYELNDILLFQYNLPAPTLMFNKLRFGFWPIYQENHCVEDFYLYLKITSKGLKIACLPEILGFYRRHSKNTSSLEFRKHGEDRISILNRYSDKHLWKASVSRSLLIQATQTLSVEKLQGIKLMIKATKIYPFNILTIRFIRFITCIFMPKPLIRIILGI